MMRLFWVLLLVAEAQANSIWEYTFTDTYCTSCSSVGFSFVQNQPIDIPMGEMFILPGDKLSACQTLVPETYCQQVSMYWRSDGLLQVNLFWGSSNQSDWQLPDEAQFALPGSLGVEGEWTNSFSVEPWGTDIQTFTVVDPEVAPEPATGVLSIVGLSSLIWSLKKTQSNLESSV